MFLDQQLVPFQCLHVCLQTLEMEMEMALLASSYSHVVTALREMGALRLLLRCPPPPCPRCDPLIGFQGRA